MDTFLQDLRYAVRTLRRSPGFAAVAILTLALGVGANTAIFSVIYGVMLRPLPYPDADRIVHLWQVGERGGEGNVSDPNFEDLRAQSRSFQALAQLAGWTATVSGGAEPARVPVAAASRDFFAVLGVQPVLGRAFAPEEQQEGASPAVVVGHGYWQRELGGDADLSRRALTIDGQVHAVVGVMPPGFSFPAGTELWTPRELLPRLPSRTAHNWQVVGRLRQDVTLEQARREATALARRLKAEHGDDTRMVDAALVPLREQAVGPVRPALLVLLGAAGFLLLIACANVANLLLARAAARGRELAVRHALGASRWRVARQLLVETLAISLTGGAIGVLLAAWGVDALLALEPGRLPRLDEVGIHWPVLAFALATSVLAAGALGLATAARGTAGTLRDALADSQRTQAGGASSHRVRGALVVSQVALTLVLLVGAGLLGRSFLRLLAVDPGFRTGGAVVMEVLLPGARSPEGRARLGLLHDELARRLGAIPGVEHVGGITEFPLAGAYTNGNFLVLARPDEVASPGDFERIMRDPSRVGEAEFRIADEGYFRAIGIPLVRGRLFDERDAPDAPHVALISESLARTRWPGEDPIGKLIQYGNMDRDLRPFTIVGIVGDVRDQGLAAEPRPTFYGLARQRSAHLFRFTYVLSGSAAPASTIASARAILRELAPEAPPRFRTMEEVFAASLSERRFSMVLLAIFGATALVLAVLGIYGVISFLVAQRTREIGVRMALGARAADVLRMVVRQGTSLALLGVGLGVVAALGLTRFLATLLYRVGTVDPATFTAVALLLVLVALLASYLPARRAARVDPMVALRNE